MAHASGDRVKAARIRQRIKKGRARPGDVEFLREYDKSSSPQGKRPGWVESFKSAVGLNDNATTTTPPPSPPASGASAQVGGGGGPAVGEAPPGFDRLDFGPDADDDDDDDEPAPASKAAPAAPGAKPFVHVDGGPALVCADPTCIACREAQGSRICAATGVRVWQPISDDSAKGMAKLLLNGIAWLVSIFRDDKKRVAPMDHEIASMAKGLQMLTHRRFNSIGAIDDIMLCIAALGMFTHRIATLPSEKKEEAREAA